MVKIFRFYRPSKPTNQKNQRLLRLFTKPSLSLSVPSSLSLFLPQSLSLSVSSSQSPPLGERTRDGVFVTRHALPLFHPSPVTCHLLPLLSRVTAFTVSPCYLVTFYFIFFTGHTVPGVWKPQSFQLRHQEPQMRPGRGFFVVGWKKRRMSTSRTCGDFIMYWAA